MSSELRMTMATRAVLWALIDEPDRPRYGFDLAREAGIATGSLYPILARLERLGWVESYWEEQGPGANRPRRRYYQLTDLGVSSASKAIDATIQRIMSKRT